MSYWEQMFFTAKLKTYGLESAIDGFKASGNYEQVLQTSFIFAIITGVLFSLVYYVLIGRKTYHFARWYYWVIPMALTIPATFYLCTIAIRQFFAKGGLGVFAYDLILEPHDIHIILISCLYSVIVYFLSSLLFKTRWFTIYYRHVPFPY